MRWGSCDYAHYVYMYNRSRSKTSRSHDSSAWVIGLLFTYSCTLAVDGMFLGEVSTLIHVHLRYVVERKEAGRCKGRRPLALCEG